MLSSVSFYTGTSCAWLLWYLWICFPPFLLTAPLAQRSATPHIGTATQFKEMLNLSMWCIQGTFEGTFHSTGIWHTRESHIHVAAGREGTVDILGWKHGVKVTASRRIALYTRMTPQKQYVVMLCFSFLPFPMKLKNGYDGWVRKCHITSGLVANGWKFHSEWTIPLMMEWPKSHKTHHNRHSDCSFISLTNR